MIPSWKLGRSHGGNWSDLRSSSSARSIAVRDQGRPGRPRVTQLAERDRDEVLVAGRLRKLGRRPTVIDCPGEVSGQPV
jgi:hypothetical protein